MQKLALYKFRFTKRKKLILLISFLTFLLLFVLSEENVKKKILGIMQDIFFTTPKPSTELTDQPASENKEYSGEDFARDGGEETLDRLKESLQPVILNWNAPLPGVSAITGYKIERKTLWATNYEVLVENTNSVKTHYVDYVLPGPTYYYRIYAINSYGVSDYPSDALVVSRDPNSFSFNWPKPDYNYPLVSQIIEKKIESSDFKKIATLSPNIVGYVDRAVTPGTTYVYRITAIFEDGYEMHSDELTYVHPLAVIEK